MLQKKDVIMQTPQSLDTNCTVPVLTKCSQYSCNEIETVEKAFQALCTTVVEKTLPETLSIIEQLIRYLQQYDQKRQQVKQCNNILSINFDTFTAFFSQDKVAIQAHNKVEEIKLASYRMLFELTHNHLEHLEHFVNVLLISQETSVLNTTFYFIEYWQMQKVEQCVQTITQCLHALQCLKKMMPAYFSRIQDVHAQINHFSQIKSDLVDLYNASLYCLIKLTRCKLKTVPHQPKEAKNLYAVLSIRQIELMICNYVQFYKTCELFDDTNRFENIQHFLNELSFDIQRFTTQTVFLK